MLETLSKEFPGLFQLDLEPNENEQTENNGPSPNKKKKLPFYSLYDDKTNNRSFEDHLKRLDSIVDDKCKDFDNN